MKTNLFDNNERVAENNLRTIWHIQPPTVVKNVLKCLFDDVTV